MDMYQRYGPALLRKARRVLRNEDDALDVVQGLFTDLYERGQHEADLPYLYRALTNRCLTMLRNRNTRAAYWRACDQFLGRCALQEITCRPGAQGLKDVRRVHEDREHKELQIRPYQPCFAHAIHAACSGHVDVHEHHISLQFG